MSVKKMSGLFQSVDSVLYLASAKLFKNQTKILPLSKGRSPKQN